jgi:hypothetical protein
MVTFMPAAAPANEVVDDPRIPLSARMEGAAWDTIAPGAGMVAEVRYQMWFALTALAWRPVVPRWASALLWVLLLAAPALGWAAVCWA